MKLFEEITEYLKKENKELIIFTILNYYNKINNDCYKMIDLIIEKINHNMNNFNNDEETYNVIDNDFITLKDLIYEYKNDIYNQYEVKILAFLTNFNEEDLIKIYQTLINYDTNLDSHSIFDEELKKVLDEEEINNFSLMVTTPSLLKEEMIITYLKRKGISHDEYLACVSAYLNIVLVKDNVQ